MHVQETHFHDMFVPLTNHNGYLCINQCCSNMRKLLSMH